MGGRSSGGGGASQSVDYPEYQKNIQANWLAGMSSHTSSDWTRLKAGNDITSLVNLAVMNNPYEERIAFNPSTETNQIINAAESYLPWLRDQVIAYLQYLYEVKEEFVVDFDIQNLIEDQSIGELFLAESDYSDRVNPSQYRIDNSLDEADYYIRSLDTIETVENELSQFDAGMRDINAVHSSAFLVGRQIIASGLLEFKGRVRSELATRKDEKARSLVQLEMEKENQLLSTRLARAQMTQEKAKLIAALTADKAKYKANLLTEGHKVIFPTVANAVGDNKKLQVEAWRMSLVALKEQSEEQLRIDNKEALWSIEVFQGAANVMASIAGGTVSSTEDSYGKMQSALGGGLSGAAAGAMIGTQTGAVSGPMGAVIGGLIGMGSTFL